MREMTIEEERKIQLKMLKTVAEYCDDNGLRYYLAGGSLLGAVRHSGYIPWDDDIDLFMPRNDYALFFRNFNDNRNDSLRAICIDNFPDYYLVMGKVIDLKTILYENVAIATPIGVYLDIFPLDEFPDNESILNRMVKKTSNYRKLLGYKSIAKRKGRPIHKKVAVKLIQCALAPLTVRRIITRIHKLSQRYNNTPNCKRIAAMVMLTYGKREIFYKEDFEERCKLPFEVEAYWAPKNYDRVLSQLYGNYLELPPVEKQVTHHDNKAYWRAAMEKEA